MIKWLSEQLFSQDLSVMNSIKRELRSPREIKKMRTAGLVVWLAHQKAAQALQPGVTTATVNEANRNVSWKAQMVF